jgi:hypothetical protein
MPAFQLALDALTAARVSDPTRFVEAGPRGLLERGLAVEQELAA